MTAQTHTAQLRPLPHCRDVNRECIFKVVLDITGAIAYCGSDPPYECQSQTSNSAKESKETRL